MTVEEFCELIEKEYYYFMYKGKRLFPFNCHTSANVISSYLSVHFDNSFVHRTFRNGATFHGWSKSDNICVDFTCIQSGIGSYEHILTNPAKNLSKDDVFNIIQEIRKEHSYLGIIDKDLDRWYSWCGVLDIEDLHGLEHAKKVENPFTINGFMSYVKDAYDEVDHKVKGCYSPLST
ncbi:hypothetical protein ACIQXI_00785 [Lysinibacillus sp. NPDC097195]|uniref:hypothetical protein n=1 Tax=Lysinibacillus sp. NPDC097195 TaxID=3364141 RepID=UPI003803A707